MEIIIICAVYIIVAAAFARLTGWDNHYSNGDKFLTILMVLFWPITLIVFCIVCLFDY